MRNWKTTLSGISAAAMSALALLAAAPETLGDVATILPSGIKSKIFIASTVAAFLLRAINATMQADKLPKGRAAVTVPTGDTENEG